MPYALKAIKILAAMVITTAVVFSTLFIAAPAAQSAPHHTNFTVITNTNWNTFKAKRSPYFAISVKASSSKGGKGIPGKAQLKIDGKHQRFRQLSKGSITFHVSRKDLPNNRWAEVAVRTWPKRDGRPSQVVKFNVKDVPKAKTSTGQKVVKVAKQQVGKPYRYGAGGGQAYDCSGLVKYAYKKATGKSLPHQSTAIKNSGRKVSKPRPGDIVWTPGHVSIWVGGGDGKVVEAARPGTDVRVVKMWQRNPTFVRP